MEREKPSELFEESYQEIAPNEAYSTLLENAASLHLNEKEMHGVQLENKEVAELTSKGKDDENDHYIPDAKDCLGVCNVELKSGPLDTCVHAASSGHTIIDQLHEVKSDRKDIDLNISHQTTLNLDNASEVPKMLDQTPSFPHKQGQVKIEQSSECGSCMGALQESEPLRVWKTMKQNGFLSSSHGGIPIPIPKQPPPSRKRRSDTLKKKVELAKREQVNRFAKIAAPSGLLSGLNPGIINHVRNSKQVHSIIEALVKAEKPNYRGEKKPENQSGRMNEKWGSGEKVANGICHDKWKEHIEEEADDGINARVIDDASYHENSIADTKRKPELMQHSMCPSANGLPTRELSVLEVNITSLSLKAAAVASKWLELLHQDLNGRLTALNQSKKRARTMIQTELPFLLSGQDNSSYCRQSSLGSNEHIQRWQCRFIEMEKALFDEGKCLEEWLRQVQEMQQHCDLGLNFFQDLGQEGLHPFDSPSLISQKLRVLERECAVRAAAASIYSTCNLAMSSDNLPCF